ncbi:glycosyl transferase family 1 [Polaribacter sp. ALD11]|uniref:glycosyltransferase n=1 Tax=Polaribacter sp. ALD11 TaxID=2058137 RepID=UPI000C319E72|nr:glycosyltransferase [Polaribacter sp. ALD11]AUC84421.1 glycosyl transferase family 1 [Polaribacter sp. ALD11]
MKILLISMPSVHVIRWIENLKETSFELFWFDILGKGRLKTIDRVQQITGWRQRKIFYIKGEHWLKKKKPNIYDKIQPFIEITPNEQLEKIIKEIQPDIIHSFEMQSCSYPILKVMNKYPTIKWIYSCWGSDLFYFQKYKNHNIKIRSVLKRIDYLHTDCLRDFKLAKSLGFIGDFTGVIPGGSGFKLNELKNNKVPIKNRNIILIKGYEHKFGRALNVIKALNELKDKLKSYEIIVFGAHKKVLDYVVLNKLPFKVFYKSELTHFEILKLMGKSKIYIGNSVSDGMPNTLLEAIIMNAFPIQSNPGNVTSEIIEDRLNGLIINNPEDINEIKTLIKGAIHIEDNIFFEKAAEMNTRIAKTMLDYKLNKQKVIDLYDNIEISKNS